MLTLYCTVVWWLAGHTHRAALAVRMLSPALYDLDDSTGDMIWRTDCSYVIGSACCKRYTANII